ncbi:DsbA family oxidoreductase [Actinomadura macrotermitis]|uniref:DSBA-like thioredoxin domain-containing protein n=1 Tax=Actinomadura macrotermitis TaxID=2585200 RepID=A0A7K0C4L2_9ACTN|nr:DsbA family oxidoreductase [Actinomadura macrotermitis]MQY08380.1 hypothetical protein [Actinomadura macrotermitis]
MLIEVYADILCPWCYIGKRRLSAALAGLEERVEVVWRSFELGPDASREPGVSAAEAMREWWGDETEARVARIRSLGAAEGLDLAMDRARPVNTFDAHRLIHLATERGLGDAMAERLLRAYHTEGLNVADLGVLAGLGVEAGVESAEAHAVLNGDRYAERVREDERRGRARGIGGVPTLVIAEGAPMSAVRSPELLREAVLAALA